MLSKQLMKQAMKKPAYLSTMATKDFSHGPFNPYRYKNFRVAEELPTNEEINKVVRSVHSGPTTPVHNLRHINPVRQSGPLPPYDGPHCMEDVRKVADYLHFPDQPCLQSLDVEELMRRAPGLTRKEAEQITSIGLTPDEEADYAYMTVNMGIDVFYPANTGYIARQVVTNSKGEKVECLFPWMNDYEPLYVPVDNSPTLEMLENHYDQFPTDVPWRPSLDLDLSVPYTWFEYEVDSRMEFMISEDQMYLPERDRPCPTARNPHSRKELWRPQADLGEKIDMLDPEYFPKTTFNVYNRSNFKGEKQVALNDGE